MSLNSFLLSFLIDFRLTFTSNGLTGASNALLVILYCYSKYVCINGKSHRNNDEVLTES